MGIFRAKQPETTEPGEQEIIDAYTSCFTGPAGDFIITDLFYLTGIAGSVFNAVDYDPIKAAHRDGMQTILKRILNYSGRQICK
jgi:hypothetical protein